MAEYWSQIVTMFTQEGGGIQPVYSNMHLLFPFVTIVILILLAAVMLIQRVIRCIKDGTPFINLKGFKFFSDGFAPLPFFGSIVLMVLYFYLLPRLHFLPCSILFLLLYNLLYNKPVENGKLNAKSVAVTVVISVIAPTIIYLLFGIAFNLTLP